MKKRLSWKAVFAGVAVVLFFTAYASYSRNGALSPSLESPVYAAPVETGCLDFKALPTSGPVVERAKVPGGGLLISDCNGESSSSHRGVTIAFYPDPHHEWNGGSLK
jgi:hypothetical protein